MLVDHSNIGSDASIEPLIDYFHLSKIILEIYLHSNEANTPRYTHRRPRVVQLGTF